LKKEPWNSSSEKAKTLEINDFGTEKEVRLMAKMPLSADSFIEVQKVLEKLINKPLFNRAGLSATISRKSIKEILSGEAVRKSFNLKAHLKAAINIEKLFTNSVEKWEFDLNPTKDNSSLEKRRYLFAPMEYKERIVPVKLTVKEFKDTKTEKRIYNIEAIDVDLNKKGNR